MKNRYKRRFTRSRVFRREVMRAILRQDLGNFLDELGDRFHPKTLKNVDLLNAAYAEEKAAGKAKNRAQFWREYFRKPGAEAIYFPYAMQQKMREEQKNRSNFRARNALRTSSFETPSLQKD
jgi:hypothetical protein